MRAPILSALIFAAMTSACSHVQTTDMTAAEHRNEAAILKAEANEEKIRYQPEDQRVVPMAMSQLAQVPEERIETYNPSDEHLAKADADMRAANEHLAAAKKLETFEAQACQGLSVAERSSCPLLASSVAQIKHTLMGFQMVMKPGVDVDKTKAMLSCHLAYAEKTGFDRPSCPLFVKGSKISKVGETMIEFTGTNAQVAAELQTQAQRVFRGATSPLSNL